MPRLLVSCFLALVACAPVKIYSHDGTRVKIGLPVSVPEYRTLLLTRASTQDPTKLETSIVTLPVHGCDDTYYLKPRGSWGASKLGFELDDGRLVGFNTEADGKGPETISGIGEVLTAVAGLGAKKAMARPSAELTEEERTKLRAAQVSEKEFFEKIARLEARHENRSTVGPDDIAPNEDLDLQMVRDHLPPPPFILQELRISAAGQVQLLPLPTAISEGVQPKCTRRIEPA